MATITSEVSTGAYCNVSTKTGLEIRNEIRNGNIIEFEYRAYIYQDTTQFSYNTWALWIENEKYDVKSYESASEKDVKYYTPWVSKEINIPYNISTTNISVGVNGTVWTPTAPLGEASFEVQGLPIITKATLSSLSIENLSDTSFNALFSITNNGGQETVNKIKLWTNSSLSEGEQIVANTNSGLASGLEAAKSYYVRGEASNLAGTTYTTVKNILTLFNNPSSPSGIVLASVKEPTPTGEYLLTWTPSTNGSTSVSGYYLKFYKNGLKIKEVDTKTNLTEYLFNGLDVGLSTGDLLKIDLYAYSKDWNNQYHFNEDGLVSSWSNEITVISDKFVYVSIDGGPFIRRKIYWSLNGGSFIEAKKEKLKYI